jgi:ribonucleoside-triphosphate reductase
MDIKQVIKRNGSVVDFSKDKIKNAIKGAFRDINVEYDDNIYKSVIWYLRDLNKEVVNIEEIQDVIEKSLMKKHPEVAKAYIVYRYQHKTIREFVESKENFISQYKKASNTANATIDDNSNMSSKNVGVLNNEIHKEDNIQISRGMVMRKLHELYPDFDSKQYVRDLNSHIIYKHDESTFAGAVAPYCVSVSMYPFLSDGIKGLGGLSAAPKNLDSYCGMYINMIFAISSQFAGAVATSEFLLYFDYFARKEWGDEYYKYFDKKYKSTAQGPRTIQQQIHQYFQQVVYSINQPAAARGMQSAFVNFSYFDKPFFEGMFGKFYFPDGTQPIWESLFWLQKEFMTWFNEERLRCILTFPVESYALVYKDGEFLDKESAEFVSQEYENGHSFFTYISDTVDSLSSCCRLKNKVQTKEFNFTNGNMGIMTGSKSVITLNLNRIIQDWDNYHEKTKKYNKLEEYLISILDRVYKYHTAYNELMWDMFDAKLLPAYRAGFIDLNKQYLTIGINGLNEAAEYWGCDINDNEQYSKFCQRIFSVIKEENLKHKVTKGHQLLFNTECVPAESLAIKNYNWDKQDGYKVPENRNLYASYIYLPSDETVSILEKIRMHGKNYIGDYLDGGSAAHLNLDSHLSKEQYMTILKYAAEQGCQYLTFNVPNSECQDCGFITKTPIHECPNCGSKKISYYDRIIGYLTKIDNWSDGRKQEQKTRIYEKL